LSIPVGFLAHGFSLAIRCSERQQSTSQGTHSHAGRTSYGITCCTTDDSNLGSHRFSIVNTYNLNDERPNEVDFEFRPIVTTSSSMMEEAADVARGE
jgi:hypothetical protein